MAFVVCVRAVFKQNRKIMLYVVNRGHFDRQTGFYTELCSVKVFVLVVITGALYSYVY